MAPPWKPPAATPSAVAGYGLADIAEHYTKLIADLPERPVVVGHSFGGLIAQQLLASGLASHAVAIDPGPPKGVTKVPLSQIRTALPVLRKKSNREAAVTLTERQFRYSFANAISKDEAREPVSTLRHSRARQTALRSHFGQEGSRTHRPRSTPPPETADPC